MAGRKLLAVLRYAIPHLVEESDRQLTLRATIWYWIASDTKQIARRTMRRSSIILICAFSVLSVTQTGCLISHSRHTVVRQGEPLQPVAFQSQQAKIAFEHRVQQKLEAKNNQSSSSLAVPFLLGLENSRRLSETAVRNDTAVFLDANADGIIDDTEVALPTIQ